jgi:hypothetical protein
MLDFIKNLFVKAINGINEFLKQFIQVPVKTIFTLYFKDIKIGTYESKAEAERVMNFFDYKLLTIK